MNKATPEDISAILHIYKDILPNPDFYDKDIFRIPLTHFSSFDNGRTIRIEYFRRISYINTATENKKCWVPVMEFNY